MYFSTALTKTTKVLVENQNVITKVHFPRLILPISSVLSGLVDFGIVSCWLSSRCPTVSSLDWGIVGTEFASHCSADGTRSWFMGLGPERVVS
jgi:hypothetical protein